MFAIHGTLVHCQPNSPLGSIEFLEDRTLVVERRQEGGRIVAIEKGAASDLLQRHGIESATELKAGQFLCPGFIDTHVHAPQYSYTGTATDLPVMEWLDRYTFPRESRHKDVKLAEHEYTALVKRLLSLGTTTVLYFATMRLEPTLKLVAVLDNLGQRAFVGKTAMDRNSPDYYIASTAENVADTEDFIKQIRGIKNSLLEPVITPRFVPTCTPELMAELGRLAAEHNVVVQSHISESLDEVAFVAHLHPEVGRDTPLLQAAGLLTQRSVMAHGTCLTDAELTVLAEHGTALAHCPLSNFFFGDKPLAVRHCREMNVKVGLGTDVAGGYSPSMLNAMRTAVINSKALRMMKISAQSQGNGKGESVDSVPADVDADLIDWAEAFYLATLGSAEALGIQDKVGSFEVGKEFDALLVDCTGGETFDLFPDDGPRNAFEKFINLGDDRNIKAVWVQGRQVK